MNEIQKMYNEVKDIYEIQNEIDDIEMKISECKVKLIEINKKKAKKDEIRKEIQSLEKQIESLAIENKKKESALTNEKSERYKKGCIDNLPNLIYEWNVNDERTIVLSKETVNFFKKIREESFYKEVKKKYYKIMEGYFNDVLCAEMRVEENAKEIYIILQSESKSDTGNSLYNESSTYSNGKLIDNIKQNLMDFYTKNKQICNFLFEILKINLENRIYERIQRKCEFVSVFERNNEIMKDTKYYITDKDYLNNLLVLCLKNNCANVRSCIEICKDKEYYKMSIEFSIVVFIIEHLRDHESVIKECAISFFDIKKVEKGLFNYFCIFNEICVLEKKLKMRNTKQSYNRVSERKSNTRNMNIKITIDRNTNERNINERNKNESNKNESNKNERNKNERNKNERIDSEDNYSYDTAYDTSFLSKIKEEYFLAIISICGTQNIDFSLSLDQYKINVNESFFGFKEIMTFFVSSNLLQNFCSSYFDSLSKNLVKYILNQENIPIQDSEKYSEFINYIFILYDNYQTMDSYCRLKCVDMLLVSNMDEIEKCYDKNVICLEKDEIVLLLIALFNDTEKRQELVCKVSKTSKKDDC
ncbi:hypothetical protein BDAP_001860 [Binucleata daphniae]